MPGTADPLVLKRLLCATDFSEGATAALDVAVALARPFQGEIRIVHVRPAPVPSGSPMACRAHGPGIDEKNPTDLIQDLEHCGEAARASGLAAQGALLQGDPPAEIVREARRTPADIIVMGRHSQGASNPWVLGSVAERVLKRAPCPVVVVRPFPRHRGERPRRVLCGLDLGETSPSTLKWGVAVSHALRADLHVLHVVTDGDRERARLAVAATVAGGSATTGLPVEASVAAGVPYQEILAVAHEKEADLIVVGTHGGGVVDRQFLGSTTLHLLRQAECPVLVVPAYVSRRQQRTEALTAAPVSAGAP